MRPHSDEPDTNFTDPDASFTLHAARHRVGEKLFGNYSGVDPGFAPLPGRVYREAMVSA